MSINTSPLPEPAAMTAPHLALRIARMLAKLIWWTVCFLIVATTMIWGIFQFWFIPNIDSLRPRIEQKASELLGKSVSIGQMSAQYNDFSPIVTFADIRIADTSLTLKQVRVTATVTSLLNLSLAQLLIDSPNLLVERDAQGKITIAGIKLQRTGQNNAGLNWLFSQPEVVINDGRLRWIDAAENTIAQNLKPIDIELNHVSLSIRNTARSHTFNLSAKPTSATQGISISGKFAQPLLETQNGRWQSWTGELNSEIQNAQFAWLKAYAPIDWQESLQKMPSIGKLQVLLQIDKQSVTGAQVKTTSFDLSALAPYADKIPQLKNLDLKGIVESADIRIADLSQASGQPLNGELKLKAKNISANVGAWLEEPQLALDGLQTEIKWQKKQSDWIFNVADLVAENSHAKLQLSADFAPKPNVSLLEGIRLKGSVARVDLSALQRYLPLRLSKNSRQYLKAAFVSGAVPLATFSLEKGELHARGKIQKTEYAFAPTTAWPHLLEGESDFTLDQTGSSLRLNLPNIQVKIQGLEVRGSVTVADLEKPVLEIHAASHASLQNVVAAVNQSPASTLISHALKDTQAAGLADFKVNLNLPIAEPKSTKWQANVDLQGDGNSVTLNSTTPPLTQIKGRVTLSNEGLQLQGVSLHTLGGELKLTNQLQKVSGAGSVSAEGLRAWKAAGMISNLAQSIRGSTNYVFDIIPQSGTGSQSFDINVASDLVGLALDFPEPFGKAAAVALPLQYRQGLVSLSPKQDRIAIRVGEIADIQFLRNISSTTPTVVQGSIAIGRPALLPERGVNALIAIDNIDLSVWDKLMTQAQPMRVDPAGSNSYYPDTLIAQAKTLQLGNRTLENVVLGASRVSSKWRANVAAKNIEGYVEFQNPNLESKDRAGSVFARLSKLTIPDAKSQAAVEQLLQSPPLAIPSIDLIIEDLEMMGKSLGRLELFALNQTSQTALSGTAQNEWRMQKLKLSTPEATLDADGQWSGSGFDVSPKRVNLNFKWNVQDAGALLKRMGSANTLKDGAGSLTGRLAWLGSPLALHYPSLTGLIQLEMNNGQFLKIDPGAGRLLSVISLQALPRLFTLNFRDVFSQGFAFDKLAGQAQIAEGVISTTNLEMRSLIAVVAIDGSADLAKETQNLHVRVLPDVNANGVSLLATLVNPLLGLGTYIADKLFLRPAAASASKEFVVTGSWRDPKVTPMNPVKMP